MVFALMNGDEDGLRRAIADGAPLDRVVGGDTILNLAIWRRSAFGRAMVKVLLDLGADPLCLGDEANPGVGTENSTAFHAAARAADVTTLKRLIQHTPHGVNALDRKGHTPLQAGLLGALKPVNYKAGVPPWVLTLLRAGADVNAHLPGQEAVLHHLLAKRNLAPPQPVAWEAWLTALLDAGQNPMVLNLKGVPALYTGIASRRFLVHAARLWTAGGTMDFVTADGRDGWAFVPREESIAYRKAWTQHEQAQLRATADDEPRPEGGARSRARL